MSNVRAFAVDENGTLKRLKHRLTLDQTPATPVADSDRTAIRNALGIAHGQQPYGAAAAYSSDFSAGVNSFTASTGISAVAGNIDAISDGTTIKDDVLRLTTDATNGIHFSARAGTFTAGKKYRIEMSVLIPAGQAFAKIRVGAGVIAAPPGAVCDMTPTVGTWSDISGEFTAPASAGGPSFYLSLLTAANSGSFQGVAGEVAYIKDIRVYELGCRQIYSGALPIDFGSIAAGASADLTIAVPGVAVNDSVSLGLPAAPTAGIIFQAFVSAAGVVTVRATNITAAAVDPASATYRVTVFQF